MCAAMVHCEENYASVMRLEKCWASRQSVKVCSSDIHLIRYRVAGEADQLFIFFLTVLDSHAETLPQINNHAV